jgi:hypothetical protein
MPRAPLPSLPARLEPLVAALSSEPGVTTEPGWGKGNVVLKADGKIFAILGTGRLVVKLPRARVDELVERGAGERFDPRRDGRLMKEWLVAGGTLDSVALVKEAHAFAGGAKAKPKPKRVRRAGGP